MDTNRHVDADWSAESLALFTQAAPQGAFIIAKAQRDSDFAVRCMTHLRRYVNGLLASDISHHPPT